MPFTFAVPQLACGSGLILKGYFVRIEYVLAEWTGATHTVHCGGIGFAVGPPARSTSAAAEAINGRIVVARSVVFIFVDHCGLLR